MPAIKFQRHDILVVNHDGELMFQTGDVLFDILSATAVYGGGTLSLYRDEALIDHADRIQEVGTHGATFAFCGFRQKFGGKNKYRIMQQLEAIDLQENDHLVLEIPANPAGPDWKLADYLRQTSGLIESVMKAFNSQSEWKLGDMRQVVARDMKEKTPALREQKIIRFRKR